MPQAWTARRWRACWPPWARSPSVPRRSSRDSTGTAGRTGRTSPCCPKPCAESSGQPRTLRWPEIVESAASDDGSTKHAFRMGDGRLVEGVHMPYEDARHPLSLQPGGLRHGLHLLRHRPHGDPAEPHLRGDRRAGHRHAEPPCPSRGEAGEPGVHGHGRTPAQPHARHGRLRPAPRPRRARNPAAAGHGQHLRAGGGHPAAGDLPSQASPGPEPQRQHGRAPLPHHARQPASGTWKPSPRPSRLFPWTRASASRWSTCS